MPGRVKVNRTSIVRKLGVSKPATRKIRGFIVDEVEKKHKRMKKDLLDEVRKNDVVKELNRGVSPVNSNVVTATAKGSNLFSFLGFDINDTHPVARLMEVLERSFPKPVGHDIRKEPNKQSYRIRIQAPLQEDIEADKDLYIRQDKQYTSRSWPEAVRRGIAGFPSYLFDKKRDFGNASFSGVAIQVKNFLRGGSFMGRPFIGRTLAKFRTRWRQTGFRSGQ